MLQISLSEFIDLKTSSGLTYFYYSSSKTYYLFLRDATDNIVFCCIIAIADATDQGFTP
jgi:hypothetical protein